MIATKRLWARRTIKLVAFLGILLKWPRKLVVVFFRNFWDLAFSSVVIGVFLSAIFFAGRSMILGAMDADADDLREAGKNACVAELLPRRQKDSSDPITLDDIRRATRDCADAVEKSKETARVNEQLRILKEAGKR